MIRKVITFSRYQEIFLTQKSKSLEPKQCMNSTNQNYKRTKDLIMIKTLRIDHDKTLKPT